MALVGIAVAAGSPGSVAAVTVLAGAAAGAPHYSEASH